MNTTSPRMLHMERDTRYVFDNRTNMKTTLVLCDTYTVYETVGSPSYQTPVLIEVSKAEAERYIEVASK